MMWSNDEAYILSKTYQDNFNKADIGDEEVINKEALSCVKTILRMINTNKIGSAKYFMQKYTKLLDLIKKLNDKMNDFGGSTSLTKFINEIERNDFVSAEKYSARALADINNLTKNYFYANRSERYDSYFNDDYYKVTTSSSFRRLQDKAQIFSLEFYDYPRTRLTHSIEVSSLAELIVGKLILNKYISKKDKMLKIRNNETMDNVKCVLKCAGAIHDIGNPPFGHFGEFVIESFYKDKKIKSTLDSFGDMSQKFTNSIYYKELQKFDGNAQTFRIVTKLLSFDNKKGAFFRAAVLGAIIKYPYSISDIEKGEITMFNESISKGKIGYFLSEKEIIEDLSYLGVFKKGYRNPLVYILEVADDISYLISDIEDSIHKRIVSIECFDELFAGEEDPIVKDFYKKLKKLYALNLKEKCEIYSNADIFEQTIKPLLSQLKSDIINHIPQIKYLEHPFFFEAFNGKTGENDLISSSKYKIIADLFDKMKDKYVFNSREVNLTEIQGYNMMNYIMNVFFDALCNSDLDRKNRFFKAIGDKKKINNKIISLMSNNFVDVFFEEIKNVDEKEKNVILYYKNRLLIDYISGMTESYVKDLYEKLITIK